MGGMLRRTVLRAVGGLAVSAAAGGCSAVGAGSAAAEVEPSPSVSKSAAASKSAGKAPDGSFALSVRDLKLNRDGDRALDTRVWMPKSGGPYPLILFSHGLSSLPEDYTNLITPWAEAGFVVAAPAYPHTSTGAADFNVLDVVNQPADASYVITQVLSRYPKQADPARVAAAGHSAGGITTIGLFSGARDDRLVAGVVLAGERVLATPFTGASAPLLFVHGKRDQTVAYADGRAAYDAVTWPKAFLTVTDGGHVVTGSGLSVVRRTSADFWRWSLYGDTTARSRLTKDATRGGVATLENHLT